MFLCGWEAWSVTFREERRSGVFLDRVLRGMFGSEKEEMKGDRGKMHNEECQQLAGSCERCFELILRYSFRELSCISIMKQQICSYYIYIYINRCFPCILISTKLFLPTNALFIKT